jgi:hypothetical protein
MDIGHLQLIISIYWKHFAVRNFESDKSTQILSFRAYKGGSMPLLQLDLEIIIPYFRE